MFGRPKPPSAVQATAGNELNHEEFLQKALVAAGEWTRFADAKVLGVFVFLGLGMADLVKVAGSLWDAKDEGNLAGWVATGGFALACGLAVVVVVLASFALFPQLQPGGRKGKKDASSLFFFAHIAAYERPEDYERAVLRRTAQELRSDVAGQTWAISQVAARKHRFAQKAYVCVVLFLVAWAGARIGLSF